MPESAEKLIGNWKTWVAELTRCVVEQVHGKERVLVVEGLEKVGNWTEKMAGMLRERVRDDADGGVVGRVRVRMRRGECKVLLGEFRRLWESVWVVMARGRDVSPGEESCLRL